MRRTTWTAAATATVLLAVIALRGAAQSPPTESGLVERTGRDLMLLDVVVTDESGNPMPGLGSEDFAIQIDGVERPIYSVDDLCAVESLQAPPADSAVTAQLQPTAAPAPAVGTPPPPEAVRYILYFDFSQLAGFGRDRAIREARRWLEDTKRPDETVQLVAYASNAGVKELSPFTSDKGVLLAALAATDEDKSLIDPWPLGLGQRRRECLERCCGEIECRNRHCCREFARQEYSHGARSLNALRAFLEELDRLSGRNELILFHEQSTLYPARLYDEPRVDRDHVRLVERIGAEATLTRTTLHVAFSGDRLDSLGTIFANVGANLADYTGGSHSRGSIDVADVVSRAGRDRGCVYRLGIVEPARADRDVYRVKVWVRGRALDARYRVQFLDDTDRWWRQARRVLARPGDVSDVAVGVRIVPRRASKKRWSAEIQVAVDVQTLALFPAEGKRQGHWETGALMTLNRDDKKWEMLGNSQVALDLEDDPAGAFVLHRADLDDLPPGEYRLAAFVRDRAANVFGAGETTLVLPTPAKGGVIGPLLLSAGHEHVVSTLPLLGKRNPRQDRNLKIAVGTLPPASPGFDVGRTVEVRTWLCPGPDGVSIEGRSTRYVSRDGRPVAQLAPEPARKNGACRTVVDRIATDSLEPGSYRYHLMWMPDEGAALERTVDFDVVAPVGTRS